MSLQHPVFRFVIVALVTTLVACDKPVAMGDANQILIVSDQSTFDALEPAIRDALEPTLFTVRNERVFDVGHVQANEAGWPNLRINRQVLLIGNRNDPPVAEAIDDYRGDAPSAPSVFQVRNVWATNQLVTVLLTDDSGDPDSVRPLIKGLGETYLHQYEEYARSRMFVTGANEELADSLRANYGFSIALPTVYRTETTEDSNVLVFRNDQPNPSELIRNITVASRPRGEVAMNAETAIAWRDSLAQELTYPPQVTEASEGFQSVAVGSRAAIQAQGVWSNPPGEFPAGGPFIVRIVDCPSQTFLVDAWLYAPGRAKYEYMYQLNTILDSFECA